MKTQIQAEATVTLESEIGRRQHRARNGRYVEEGKDSIFFRAKIGRMQVAGCCMSADDEVGECVCEARSIVNELERYGITYPLAWVTEFITGEFRSFLSPKATK